MALVSMAAPVTRVGIVGVRKLRRREGGDKHYDCWGCVGFKVVSDLKMLVKDCLEREVVL